MATEVTRHIKPNIERELWARSAGRCQFDGCNKILFRSSVTNESVHTAQKAHIYSFSENGPRGWGPFKKGLDKLNDISNLMLACHECHLKIDRAPERYPADMLIDWKNKHEDRVEIVTGIASDKKSHVVMYGANIGQESTPLVFHDCVSAMFPDYYPANEKPILLSMQSSLRDGRDEYWQAENAHLEEEFKNTISRYAKNDNCKHFSVFALAPQPLLIKLGVLLTDKVDVETFQPHREPKGWRWQAFDDDFKFIIKEPQDKTAPPALLFSLSDNVDHERVRSVLGEKTSLWEVTVEAPHNDFLQSKLQLVLFRQAIRKLMVDIKKHHGNATPLHILPVMPVSCCIEFGRARMPKADMDWIVYDHNPLKQRFTQSLVISGGSNG
ncbi:HNH endonuclease [Pseudoalteromonas gelatinilytica]|uniref:SMODS-associated and fused to various effectors domain-containing protein n=1 Tax=Pseudoalteromonas gelatinilytica TaxID=1703256 RepID=A0ABQ1T3F5_9GAMM|nr:SAVED domain-containing protein [Pseudoalteromonas profundi]GGE82248.1 hypothetical protein GCM10008027_03650 [Pseudoalteromonas profundi]